MLLLDQLVSLAGAAMVLAAYLALQRGWMRREDRAYNALNLLGSVLLTYVAVKDRRAGFIVLEGAWALLSLPGTLARRTM
jgi:drug/metabolite transporter (DMT)-like permease